jgi:sortase A
MRRSIVVIGEACLTAGIVVALFFAYLAWGTGPRAARAQQQYAAQLYQQWRARPGPGIPASGDQIVLRTGEPFAFLRIPAFGPRWRFSIIEGTALAQLNVSPGHVPGTQLPGQVGNFAIAGHRVTAGNPFWGLPALHAGDMVYVDTRHHTYAYRIADPPAWVAPTDLAVLDPVPGHPGQRARRSLITLITCDPAWTGTHRVIVIGVLVRARCHHRSEAFVPALLAPGAWASAGRPGW